jgi:seryl-tRNA synthetase
LKAKREKEAEELKKKVEETKENTKQKEEEEKQAKKDGKPIKEPPFMDFLMNFIGAAKIHINRLHIRYEDDYFNHNRPISFGFLIEQIELDNSETNFTF